MAVFIHGKPYITASERLQALQDSGKSYEVIESAPFQAGDRWVWRVSLRIDERTYIGNAEVHLNAKPGTADATDPWACGETSAYARALGWAGFGVIDSIASADEIVRSEPRPLPPRVAAPQPNLAAQSNGQAPHGKPDPLKDELNRVYGLGRGKCFTDPKSFAQFVKGVLCLESTPDVRMLTTEQLNAVEAAINQVNLQNGLD